MPTAAKHDVVFSTNGKLALSVCDKSLKPDIKGIARLFDLVERKQLAEFEVRHECPGLGTRIALSSDSRFCFVGCYNVYGIACYSIKDGKEIWRRKDLKAVQSVTALDFQNWIFCGRQDAAAHLLDATTGDTVKKFSGVEDIYGSPLDETVVVVGRSLELHRPFGKKLWTQKPGEKTSCGVYFTKHAFLVLEFDRIRCFNLLTLELLWSYQPVVKTRFFKRFIFNEKARCFQIFQIRDDAPYVVSLDENSGQVLGEIKLPVGFHGDFCLGGTALFNCHLGLLSAETGELLHDFATDAILAQDPQHKNQLLQSLAKSSKSLAELEQYMKSEGFSEQEIKKALFVKIYNDEMAKRRNKS